jgi:cell division protein YceG involved in septum cleavage
MSKSKLVDRLLILLVLVVCVLLVTVFHSPHRQMTIRNDFIVEQGTQNSTVIQSLKGGGYISNKPIFHFVLDLTSGSRAIEPAVYRISNTMNMWQLATTFSRNPYARIVTIDPGTTNEILALRLKGIFKWNDPQYVSFLYGFKGPLAAGIYALPIYLNGAELAAELNKRPDSFRIK